MRRRAIRNSRSTGADPGADAKEDSAEAAIRNAMAIQPNGIAFGPGNNLEGHGDGMRSVAVVYSAGATITPTAPSR